MNNKNIIRTAAIVFSEEHTALKTLTVQRKIIESVFVENTNHELTFDNIIDELKNSLNMDFDYEEVKKIVETDKKSYFELRLDVKTNEYFIKLEHNRFENLKEKEYQYSIEPQIQKFIDTQYEGVLSKEKIYSLLLKYFYELLNKNIETFKKIANPKNRPENLFIDPSIFDIEERELINKFLEWDDINKNKSIFALISYTLEYAVVNNHHESSAVFLNSIKNKIFYLDNNVLYRAIGLNGENRQRRILTFIEKCIASGQKIKISKFSQDEFKATIKHNIKALQKVPFKKVNYNLFNKYSIDPSIYEYYHKWKSNRSTYSFELFTTHIYNELETFFKKYDVDIDYKIPFDVNGKEELKVIDNYKIEIARAKGNSFEQSHQFDALNTYLVEKLRGENKNTITDTKYFFVSTDQKLRNWDFSRNNYQPTALLPSHWMAILLKYFSRTNDDYSSFISFLKLKTNQPIINENDLNTILSGISELTEDFKKQETILAKMVELKFEGILNGHNNPEVLYQKSIEFVKKEFESEIENLNVENLTAKQQFSLSEIKFNKQLLEEKESYISELKNQKRPLQKLINKKYKNFQITIIVSIIIYYLLLAYFTYIFGWDIMEPITYFLGLSGIIAPIIFACTKGDNFNPLKYFETHKMNITDSVHNEFNFNQSKFERYIDEISALKNEIKKMEMDYKSNFN
jgi:hypothetical protein